MLARDHFYGFKRNFFWFIANHKILGALYWEINVAYLRPPTVVTLHKIMHFSSHSHPSECYGVTNGHGPIPHTSGGPNKTIFKLANGLSNITKLKAKPLYPKSYRNDELT